MREKPDTGEMPDVDAGPTRKRVDLSLPQVAGSAVAAVVAAKLASYFGVYGTILGAGLVSVVATCGGTLFQHFFKRTGEQIRDVTVLTAPPRTKPRQASAEREFTAGEFTEATVHRARVRGWKRPVVAAALVFGVTMAGITTYELVSGQSFSGDSTSTTVKDALRGSGSEAGPGSKSEPGSAPSPESSESSESAQPSGGGSAGSAQDDSAATTPTPTPSSSATPGAGDDTASPSVPSSPAPSATATTPEPDASSRSRSADPDRADPAER